VMLSYLFQMEAAASSGRMKVGTSYVGKLLFEGGMSGFPYTSPTYYENFRTKIDALYNSNSGYAAWDSIKTTTLPQFFIWTKLTVHLNNILTMLPYNGFSSSAATQLAAFATLDGTIKIPFLTDFAVEPYTDGTYVPLGFSSSVAGVAMYRTMVSDINFTSQVTMTATPYACTYTGRRLLGQLSSIFAKQAALVADSSSTATNCPTIVEMAGMSRAIFEAIDVSVKANAWITVGLAGAPVFATAILDAKQYETMVMLYRNIFSQTLATFTPTCGLAYYVSQAGFGFDGQLSWDVVNAQLVAGVLGPYAPQTGLRLNVSTV